VTSAPPTHPATNVAMLTLLTPTVSVVVEGHLDGM
jgi:hypothetical protein